MTRFRILYSVDNLVELFQVDAKTIKMWGRLGILPSLDGYSPKAYDAEVITAWVEAGLLEKHRPHEYHHEKGVY